VQAFATRHGNAETKVSCQSDEIGRESSISASFAREKMQFRRLRYRPGMRNSLQSSRLGPAFVIEHVEPRYEVDSSTQEGTPLYISSWCR
jgi:hypothetical protein